MASIAEGKTDPGTILKCIHGRVINKHGRDTLLAAVTASFSQTDITVIRQYWELIAVYLRQSEECQSQLTALCESNFPTEYKRLQTIPGVKERAATAIIAETGVDMKMFATAAALVGWCELKPRNSPMV